MKKTSNLLKRLLLPVCFIACTMFFGSCNSTKYLMKGPTITYVNWNVTFKEHTSEVEKEKAFAALEKFILHDFFEHNPNTIIINLKFNITKSSLGGSGGYNITASIDPGDVSQSGFATVKPRPGGPKRLLISLSPFLNNIQPILPNGQLGEFER